MSRARRAPSSPVQLFPFLAVLVSAIGALVLLLLAINRQAVQQAIAASVAKFLQQSSAEENSLACRRQELEKELTSLHAQQGGLLSEQISVEQRLILTDEKIRIEAVRVESTREELDRITRDRAEMERQIEAIQLQISAVQQAKARLAADQTNLSRTFVPVIHPGANGTARQPIYIECTADGVVLQPEGVVVPATALESSPIAGDALARAVRALGQFYLSRDVGREQAEALREWEPYPLLLVRPDGIATYYAARRALEQFDSPFGYELIEADWSLRFPDPDPRARAVALAAMRQPGRGPGGGGPFVGNSWRGNRWTNDSGGDRYVGGGQGEPGASESWESSGLIASRGDAGQPGMPPIQGDNGLGQSGGAPEAEEDGDSPGVHSPGGSANQGNHGAKLSAPEEEASRRDQSGIAVPASRRQPAGRASLRHNDPPALKRARGSPGQRGGTSEEEGQVDGEVQGRPLPASPLSGGSGKIPIPRRISVDCYSDYVIVGPREVRIDLGRTDSAQESLATLGEEIDREVIRWGPPGMTFRWEPQLACRVHAGALELFYRLRLALVGSEVSVDHVIIAEDDLDTTESAFIRNAQRSTLDAQRLWE